MILATSDDRDPLTATLAAAKRAGHADCAKWQEELTVMTAELSTKFFGTRNVEMIRSGLGMAVKLLGMGLLEQSKGLPDVGLWLQTLERLSLKGVTSVAIERIKLVATLPESPMLKGLQETEPRTLLLLSTSCADAKEAWIWLDTHSKSRREFLLSIRLAKWLLAQTPSGRVKDRNLRHSDDGTDMLLSDEVIDEVLANVCGLPRDEDGMGMLEPIKLTGPKYRAARVAYDALVERLDAGLKQALIYNGRSWFDRYVLPAETRGKGAPRVAKT